MPDKRSGRSYRAERRQGIGGAAHRIPARAKPQYIIGPDKGIKALLAYPMTSGRNFTEILRLIDSLQLTAKHKVATPANWAWGEDVIIAGSVSNEDAQKQYPDGWKSPKLYLRVAPQPKG